MKSNSITFIETRKIGRNEVNTLFVVTDVVLNSDKMIEDVVFFTTRLSWDSIYYEDTNIPIVKPADIGDTLEMKTIKQLNGLYELVSSLLVIRYLKYLKLF